MKLNEFFKGAMKVATAIVVAVVVLSVLGWTAWKFQDMKEKSDAKQYEEIKLWRVDLKENLQMTLLARTKLVDGRLLTEVNVDGYPAYLTDPLLQAKNRDAGITLLFQDKDGFKVSSKPIAMREFSGIVDSKGARSGFRYEFDDYMSVADYARISKIRIEWTLETVIPPAPVVTKSPEDAAGDHCAPNISKAERLKRLAKHGTLRETGAGGYEAGNREVLFNTYDSSLVYCR
jgi:hypothetical protein